MSSAKISPGKDQALLAGGFHFSVDTGLDLHFMACHGCGIDTFKNGQTGSVEKQLKNPALPSGLWSITEP